jgi:DNA mismatch repair protein MutH
MIKTTKDLCDYIAATFPNEITETVGPMDAAIWFCCIQQAKDLSGYDLKDLARVIQGGMPSYDNDADGCIQEWLDLHNQQIAESKAYNEEFTTIEQILSEFYNKENE